MEATESVTSRIVVPPGDATAVADGIVSILDDWAEYTSRAAGDATRVAELYSRRRYRSDLVEALGLSEP
ncbi:hypothetical protein G7085_05230 [Tessaracoccus sp. HDW20]|uniref:hypothetical protein n=1 Tax=Tessaracoccus coleopterorum TaxID=2714950 RepID=UPI0018D35777|nr:hypothetical protein [Tessaracoccus coleopterorum]NHB84232.1 hypothetical protein [Tessaracoccus coleopterorum]